MRRAASVVISLVLLAAVVTNLFGCAALKKKFTRKKKDLPKTPIYQVKKYEIKPSFELYEKHYIFWVNWNKKLSDELGRNTKSDIRNIKEMIKNLDEMSALLIDEKAASFLPYIGEMKKAEAIIVKRNLTKVNETRIRRIIEREGRAIKRKFSPSRMANYVRKEWK